ncbi:MAG: hypothetical protein JRG73_20055 [Deltaproteobacteria bacterium]|nr:hypothetical protein [Deltaproteobacteria bacterium]
MLQRIQVTIQGVTPLICNKFTDAKAQAATEGTRGMRADDGEPYEQAESRLYLGLKGKPMIPQPNVLRCIIDGGIFHKVGKTKVTTQKTSQIPAAAKIEGIEIPIKSKNGWRVDTRAVRIPSTGGRILCHRPCFDDWELSFTIVLDTEVIPVKLLRQILDDAGKRIGLGDFRPACKGPFGTFVVTKWVIEEAA